MKKIGHIIGTFVISALIAIGLQNCDNQLLSRTPTENIDDLNARGSGLDKNAKIPYNIAAFKDLGNVPDLTWNTADKNVAKNALVMENTVRKDSSGEKIYSNTYSKETPGIYFIWDQKDKDNGYLKVADWMFEGVKDTDFHGFEYFNLTAKESNKYFDLLIKPGENQKKTEDGNYVFFIPQAQNNKNINMVLFNENGYELKKEKENNISEPVFVPEKNDQHLSPASMAKIDAFIMSIPPIELSDIDSPETKALMQPYLSNWKDTWVDLVETDAQLIRMGFDAKCTKEFGLPRLDQLRAGMMGPPTMGGTYAPDRGIMSINMNMPILLICLIPSPGILTHVPGLH